MFVGKRDSVIGENQQSLPAPTTVMNHRRDSGCLKRSECGLLELFKHVYLAGSARVRLRFKSSSSVSLRLSIAIRPAGNAERTSSDTATVIPNAILKRA